MRSLGGSRWIIPGTLLALALLIAAGLWLYTAFQNKNDSHLTAASQNNVAGGYRTIAYKGKNYRYNSRITSVLLGGVDSVGEMRPNELYRFAPRADSISLVVMDEYHRKMTIVAINRNTVTKIHKYTLYGYDRGEFVDQIAGAFCYGENGEVSCKNLCTAVSELLYGIPINEYVVSNRSSLPEIGNVIGDVSVTVPNDDLVKYGFSAGETAIINADNIARFLRSRDTEEDFSNAGRMERQKAYINAAIDKIVQLLEKSPTTVWNKIEAMEYCMQTNITRSRYIDLTNTLSSLVYQTQDYYTPEGEYVVGEEFEEFYPDEEALLDKVVELFYIEA